MRKNSGFTLIQLMVVLVITAILAAIAIPDLREFITGSKKSVVHQQAAKFQEHLTIWIAEQKSLAAAASLFQPGDSGAYVPKDPAALVVIINESIETEQDRFRVEDGKILTETMKSMDAWIEISWPQPVRQNYPRVELNVP